MERGERFHKIHQALRAGRCVTAAQFQQELGVSRATFMRDLEYLRDRYQAPIVHDAARGGYRYQPGRDGDAPFELPGLWFSADELHALLTLHALIEQMGAGLLAEQVQPLRARLQSLLGDSAAAFAELRRRVRIFSTGQRTRAGDAFNPLAQAVLARQQVRLTYRARSTDETTSRTVSPQRLIHYRGNWYVDAWCHLRQDVRSFAVDAIHQVERLDAPCVEIPEATLTQTLDAHYGIVSGIGRQWAVLRFNPERARWVRDEVWHAEQLRQLEPDGHLVLTVPYASALELRMEILKYGAEVEVLAPPELRAAIAREAAQMAARYADETGAPSMASLSR